MMLCPDHIMAMLCTITTRGWTLLDLLPKGLILVDHQKAPPGSLSWQVGCSLLGRTVRQTFSAIAEVPEAAGTFQA